MHGDSLGPLAADVSRRFRLRDATRAEHGRLDALITGAGFLSTVPMYRAYLTATLGAREAIEHALDGVGVAEIYPDWPRRKMAVHIRQDLRDLGQTEEPPIERRSFAVTGRGGMFGALYVLEGASLGARLLQKAVLPLRVDAEFGARHLAMQTADSSVWRRFTALLDAADLDANEDVECALTAARAFERFEQVYREALVRNLQAAT